MRMRIRTGMRTGSRMARVAGRRSVARIEDGARAGGRGGCGSPRYGGGEIFVGRETIFGKRGL